MYILSLSKLWLSFVLVNSLLKVYSKNHIETRELTSIIAIGVYLHVVSNV